eukprot:scaffold649_cov347-Pavlova_lutheri.AAC.45
MEGQSWALKLLVITIHLSRPRPTGQTVRPTPFPFGSRPTRSGPRKASSDVKRRVYRRGRGGRFPLDRIRGDEVDDARFAKQQAQLPSIDAS